MKRRRNRMMWGSRRLCLGVGAVLLAAAHGSAAGQEAETSRAAAGPGAPAAASYLGFDRNPYPGDDALAALRRHFAFAGYWLNIPPGARGNGWAGKRETLRRAGFGFLVLWNGRLDREILALKGRGTAPSRLGEQDAAAAIAAARHEGFASGAVLFLDQEEGGRMLPEQAAYLLSWTEAVAKTGFRAGAYASGQPVDEGPAAGGGRVTITTAEDIAEQVRARHLHPVVLWVAEDACPPANGCSYTPPALSSSGTAGAAVWQYAQSPRRPAITRACAKSYAPDGNCVVPGRPDLFVDLNVAASADPSGGR